MSEISSVYFGKRQVQSIETKNGKLFGGDIFEYTPTSGGYAIIGLKSSIKTPPSKVKIPAEHEGLPVVEIWERALYNSKITSIDVASSVKVLKDECFYTEHQIRVTLHDNVFTYLGKNTLCNCVGFNEVRCDGPIYTTFENCVDLERIEGDYTIWTNNPGFSVSGCVNLTWMKFEVIKYLGNYPFRGLNRVRSMDLRGLFGQQSNAHPFDGVTGLGEVFIDNAGMDCSGLVNNPIWHYVGPSRYVVYVASTVHQMTITRMNNVDDLYMECPKISAVNFYDDIKELGDIGGIKGCSLLNLPADLELMADGLYGFNNITDSIVQYGNGSYAGTAQNPYLILIKFNTVAVSSWTIHPDCRIISKNVFGNVSESNFVSTFSGRGTLDVSNITCFCNYCFPGMMFMQFTFGNNKGRFGTRSFYETKSFSGDYDFSNYEIGTQAFMESSIAGVSTGKVGDESFRNCTSLVTATINQGDSLAIGSSFMNCTALVSATLIGDNIKEMSSTFSGCNHLTNLVIPDNVERVYNAIPKSACEIIDNIYYASSNVTRYKYVVGQAGSISSVTLHENARVIVAYAFQEAYMSSLNINKVIHINSAAFQLASIQYISSNAVTIESIGSQVFHSCSRIKSLMLADYIRNTSGEVFTSSSDLSLVERLKMSYPLVRNYLNKCNNNLRLYLSGCDYEVNYYYANSKVGYVEFLEGNTISNPSFSSSISLSKWTALTEVVVHCKTYIPSYFCYNSSSITKLTIGKDVTGFGSYAFYNMPNLTTVVYEGTSSEFVAKAWRDNYVGGTTPTNLYVRCSDGNIPFRKY